MTRFTVTTSHNLDFHSRCTLCTIQLTHRPMDMIVAPHDDSDGAMNYEVKNKSTSRILKATNRSSNSVADTHAVRLWHGPLFSTAQFAVQFE